MVTGGGLSRPACVAVARLRDLPGLPEPRLLLFREFSRSLSFSIDQGRAISGRGLAAKEG